MGVGVMFGVVSLFLLRTVPEPRMAEGQGEVGFLRSLALPYLDRSFRRFLGFPVLWSFAAGFAGPFFTVYMIQDLGINYALIGAYTNLGMLASLYCVRFWGQLADRFGNKPVLSMAACMKAIFPFLWVFATSRSYIYLGLVHLVRAFNSAQKLTELNMALKLSPEEDKAVYLSGYRSLTKVCSAVSPILGGILAGVVAGRGMELPFLSLHGLHFMFILSGILRLSSLLVLRTVDEPDVRTMGYMIRVLRQVEGVSPSDGVSSFLQFWFAPVGELAQIVREGGRVMKESIWGSGDSGGDE
jgi:MFS family permease